MSLRQCVLHAGMSKTGSSSIQQSLHGNASLKGAHWVDLGEVNPGRLLALGLVEVPTQTAQAKREALSAEIAAKLSAEALSLLSKQLAAPAERVVLSAEQLFYLRAADLERLRGLAAAQQREVSVVAYVRAARGYMESILQERAKKGMKGMDFDDMMPKYQRRFGPHFEVFGANRVQLWHFEPRQFPAGCVVQDFCSRMKLQVNPASIQRRNESLSRGAVALLTHYWLAAPKRPGVTNTPAARAFARLVRGVPGPKCRLSPEALEPVFKRERSQIEWMQDRLGVRLDDLGEAHADDVHTAEDLLQVPAEAQQWLEEKLGRSLGKDPKPHELGQAMRSIARAAVQA